MNKGKLLFIAGLVMFMVGIYLSTYWVIVGTLIGIGGGLILGLALSFFHWVNKIINQNKTMEAELLNDKEINEFVESNDINMVAKKDINKTCKSYYKIGEIQS
ncbi:hypothetical protein [Cytobacillus purgationiresistens]|uniref:Uncharacterized protein n=1 Tax=Cytobacillus purgationiresistens TaxID=863449 RepID=A0ABU0AUL3_9BACI|nr:hypothetical protein [Cytobacillus purgationiresistens]MDQ0273695.1 hypothetical protein [Cytobacillus purgationiresistens]